MVNNNTLPVFIVEGPNWQCEVALDDMNAEFPHEEQAFEAATKAVEAFKGVLENLTFEVKTPTDEPPYMGLALFAFLKGSDPDKTGIYIPSHIALANGGFYKDSHIVYLNFLKHVEEIKKQEQEQKIKLIEDLKEFEKQLKKESKAKAKKTQKQRKKKGGNDVS